MSEKKKLVLLELDDETHEKLKNAALQSSRILGNEVALRLEHAINHFEGLPSELVEQHKTTLGNVGNIIQVQLQEKVHTKIKTTASSSNIFMKEFSVLLLINSLEAFEFVASPENAIPKLQVKYKS